ncbi:MAG: efflux RND transporter permease subunit [Pseudomonadota bacterium]
MSYFTPFYQKPRLTALAIGFILVAGLAAILTLPRQEDPIPRERYARVTTFFFGASAARMEALVLEKLEKAIEEVPEVAEMKSTARTGVSVTVIELADTVHDTDEVWSRVRSKLKDVEPLLPPGAGKPVLEVTKLPAVTLLVALRARAGVDVPIAVLHRLAKDLETRLRNVPGTEETDIFGEPGEEFLVTVDPVRLAGAGLTLQDISAALALADNKSPSGQLRSAQSSLIVEVGGELTSLERIRKVPLASTGDGRVLRIGDIADVAKAEREPPQTLALIDGRRAVAVSALMQGSQRVDRWTEKARGIVADFRQTLPGVIELDILIDQSVYTQGRLVELAQNFFLGVIAVVGILLIVLGWRSALLVGIALPLSVAMVLGSLKFLGIPLHQMSITGMIIALGLLIDNAIVVIDEYNHNRARGLAVEVAAQAAVKHLQVPLFASTLTTALTFAPIYLMPGGAGDFVGAMALTVILAIFASLVLSLTVVPALAAFADHKRPLKSQGSLGYSHPGLADRYRRTIDWVLARPRLGIGISIVLPLIGFVLGSQLVEQFFPPVERDQFQIQLSLPADTPIAETREVVARANAIMGRFTGITGHSWFLGEAAPKAFYNVILSRDGVPSFAAAIVQTESQAATRRIVPMLQAAFIRELPQAEALALPFEQGPPAGAPIELRIIGPDLDVLRQLGEDVRAVLATSDNITYTRAEIAGGRAKLMLVPDEEAARQAGFAITDIAAAIAAGLEGIEGGSVLEDTEELPVRVRLAGAERDDVARLLGRALVGPATGATLEGGAGVPLAALVRGQVVPEDAVITRRNRERVNVIQGYIIPFTLPSVALNDFKTRLEAARIALPAGYRFEFGGDAESRDEAVGNLMSSVGVLAVVMIGAIVLTFNSVRLASVIFAVAGLSVGVAFLALWLCNQPRGFMAIIGIMGLIGLAINGAIVVLSNLRASPAARAADPIAIRDTVMAATRHIVGTTLTTIAGFLPLILWADGFWQPLSLAIAGGVIGSALLALYFTPALFLLIARAKQNRAPISDEKRSAALPLRPAAE